MKNERGASRNMGVQRSLAGSSDFKRGGTGWDQLQALNIVKSLVTE
jgi:hypothetical protein